MNKAAACAVGVFLPDSTINRKHLSHPGSGTPIPFVSNLVHRIVHGDFPSCHDERTDLSARLLVD